MKTLFCTNNNQQHSYDLAFYPPLGAAYLASCLIKNGHTASILDLTLTPFDPKKFKRNILEEKPDIVGFTAYSSTLSNCLHLAEYVKEILPSCLVVFGGPHPSYLSRETLANGTVDIVVTGEGEQTIIELANAIADGNSLNGIPGLLFKQDSGIIDNGPRELIADLDTIPFPAFDLMTMGKYRQSITRNPSGKPFFTLITSRGCPYECTFCSHKMFGKRIRYRSPRNVVDEIELLVKKYQINEFLFLDDTFTLNPQRVVTICELLIKKNLAITWTCNGRADNASAELYSTMQKAGCRAIFIGAESASQEMLNSMKKEITVGQVENAVRLAKQYIGHVICGFIFGMPGDTLEKAQHTIAFAKKLNPDYASFFIAAPVPGSEIFDIAITKGALKKSDIDWEHFFDYLSPSVPFTCLSSITRNDLIKLEKQALRQFYFRPSYIMNRLRKIRSLSDLYQYFQGLKIIFNYELTTSRNK